MQGLVSIVSANKAYYTVTTFNVEPQSFTQIDSFDLTTDSKRSCGSAQKKPSIKVMVSPHAPNTIFVTYRAEDEKYYIRRRVIGGPEDAMVLPDDDSPTAIFAIDDARVWLGYHNHIDQITFSDEVSSSLVHEFDSGVKFKAIDAFAADGQRIVAVDDMVWPKYAIVFDQLHYTYTFELPSAGVNSQYHEASLSGDQLACLTTQMHRGGDGQKILVIRLKGVGEDIEHHEAASEFLRRTDKKVSLVPGSHPRQMTDWVGVAHWKGAIAVGAGKRGVMLIKDGDIKWMEEGNIADLCTIREKLVLLEVVNDEEWRIKSGECVSHVIGGVAVGISGSSALS